MLLDICQICRSARNVCNIVMYSNVIKDALARVKQATMAKQEQQISNALHELKQFFKAAKGSSNTFDCK